MLAIMIMMIRMTMKMMMMTLLMTMMIIRMTMMSTYIHGPVLVAFPLELEEVAWPQQREQHAVVCPGIGRGLWYQFYTSFV